MVIMDIWYHLLPFFFRTSLMSILAYGLNHRTASLDLRERVAFSPEDLDRTLQALTSEVQGIEEAAIISTCNRTEIYCATDASREEDISHWLTDTRPVTLSELKGASYKHLDQDAARHAIRVASGLDELDDVAPHRTVDLVDDDGDEAVAQCDRQHHCRAQQLIIMHGALLLSSAWVVALCNLQ